VTVVAQIREEGSGIGELALRDGQVAPSALQGVPARRLRLPRAITLGGRVPPHGDEEQRRQNAAKEERRRDERDLCAQ
jgi:hypothetical protein